MMYGGKGLPRGDRGGSHRSANPHPRHEHTEADRDRPTTAVVAVVMMCPREWTGGSGGQGE